MPAHILQNNYLLRVNGTSAIILAVLTAAAKFLWCFAQVPVNLLGIILPLYVINWRKSFASL